MKVVFLTYKSPTGAAILRELKCSNIPVEAIVIDTVRPNTHRTLARKLRRYQRRLGVIETALFGLDKLKRRLIDRARRPWSRDSFYLDYSTTVFTVDDVNGERCRKFLEGLEPDLVVLGGSRILRPNIIRIPRIGVLNAHPGLLPKYRGVDVIPWAILNGDPVGVTIHFVDEGVDTGGIIVRRKIELMEGDTIPRLKSRAKQLSAELMADVVLRIVEGASLQRIAQTPGEGKQYHRMPRDLLRETERRLRASVSPCAVNTDR